MTPKKNQAKSTNIQTDAADASKSKKKQQQWRNTNQINIKKNKSRKTHWRHMMKIIGRVMRISWRRSICFCKERWMSRAGNSIQGWGVVNSLSARLSSAYDGLLATVGCRCNSGASVFTHSARWAGPPSRGKKRILKQFLSTLFTIPKNNCT